MSNPNPNSNLNLPCPLVDIDEKLLPAEVVPKVAHLVSLGHNPKHLMVSVNLDVHVSEELAMLHAD